MSQSAYQVIARRWRPKQFSELVGQDHVVRTLGNAIDLGRIAHAYLFVGPRGTGKTTSARLFAKSLNWEDGPSLEVPEDSEIGQAIMEGRCLDVIEIDGASNNSVEQVRDLRDECQYAPSQCRYKIYVIDEVHMLSQQAFNALLKTLEEPPPHVKFVFATTESQKVLPTIVSRCQRFEFRSIPTPLIVKKLREICEAEEINADESALSAIARMAMGGMRDAQSILDQMISFCGKQIGQDDVLEVYGLAATDLIEKLLDSMIAGDYEQILQTTDIFSEEGIDFYRALLDLSEILRSRLIESLRGESVEVSPEQLTRMLDALREGESLVRLGLSEKANFEVTIFRAVEACRTRSIDQVIRKISQVLPADIKKKSVAKVKSPAIGSDLQKDSKSGADLAVIETSVEKVNIQADPKNGKTTLVAQKSNQKKEIEPSTEGLKEDLSNQDTTHLPDLDSSSIHAKEKNKLRIVDPEKIKERVDELPEDIREIVEKKFKAEYVALEKIDPQILI
jgi:DNA polymerase-3 subunit gamma/tau